MTSRKAPSKTTRREFLATLATGLGSVTLAPVARATSTVLSKEPTPDAGRRPNVVLIMADRHRWQSLPFTETPQLVAPNLSRLAQEGFSLDNFISQYPAASPSRAMLLTGRWPRQTGVLDETARGSFGLSPSETTIGDTFSDAEYETAYIGHWDLAGRIKSLEPYGFGQSIVWSVGNDHWVSDYFDRHQKLRQSRLYSPTHMTSQALEFISKDRDQPFLLVLALSAPRGDYVDAPTRFSGLYWDENSLPLRRNVAPTDDESRLELGLQYRGYHGHVSAIDYELGRILDQLTDQGIEDDTIVIYTSTHGEPLGSHRQLGTRTSYAESVRVPCLIRWPGNVSRGGRSDVPIGSLDLLPTLCALADIPIPSGCAGRAYADIPAGRLGPEPDSQLIMNIAEASRSNEALAGPSAYRGLFTRSHTYAVRAGKPSLLFDNQKDPYQEVNLAADPAHADTRAELHARIVRWLEISGDDFPTPSP